MQQKVLHSKRPDHNFKKKHAIMAAVNSEMVLIENSLLVSNKFSFLFLVKQILTHQYADKLLFLRMCLQKAEECAKVGKIIHH